MAWIKKRGIAGATAVPSISRETLGLHMVPLPPIAEQREIGAALRALDEQIAAHRAFTRLAEQARSTFTEDLLNGVLTLDHTAS